MTNKIIRSNEVAERLTWKKNLALATTVALGFAACSTGNGDSIENCGSEGTTTPATFVGDDGYDESTDPAILANFGAALDESRDDRARYDDDNTGVLPSDPIDKVGEVACTTEEDQIVLSTVGAQMQGLYLEGEAPSQED